VKITASTKGLLFDMDGVLISSIGSVTRCWRRWAKLYEIPNADTYEIPHGVRALEIIHSLRPDVDAAEALRVIEDMEIEDTADLKVLPGVKALLESLPPERWAIVTSSTRRLLLGRLKAAGLPVPERIVSADDVERGKPDPLPYVRGAEMLGLRPADCIVVEDAPSGVNAGVAAGCRVIGVLGTHAAEELPGAEWYVRTREDFSAKRSGDELVVEFEAV
jgi:mannitol-1-/sugar-/sorbitol-6-phosphatase